MSNGAIPMPSNSNDSAVDANKYRSLVEEAYIRPIRSALIIDDAFPTLEGYLNNAPIKNELDIERLKKLVQRCRSENFNWLVDVHDGSEVETQTSVDNLSHLHQSDLLILDYHLDGDERNDKAIRLLQRLASNDHFNLVIVYTNGYGKGHAHELLQVGHEIARSLTQIPENIGNNSTEIPEELEDWEADEDTIMSTLLEMIDAPALIRALNADNLDWPTLKGLPEFRRLRNTLEERQIQIRKSLDALGTWLVSRKARSQSKLFAPQSYGNVQFSTIADKVWIRADKIFVAVIGKQTQPAEIIARLLDALVHWNPSPHRLLMAKVRAELDMYGVGAEIAVLNRKFVQAGWMQQMLNANELERPWRIRHTTNQHWEQMIDVIQADVQRFAKDLCETIKNSASTDEIVKQHTGIDLSVADQLKLVKTHLNCYVCSKEVEGHHLTPGHILRLYGGEKLEYWLCLSPACDLVPGQSQRWGKDKSDGVMPFKAVLLEEIPANAALKAANGNEVIFVSLDERIQAFRFCTPGSNPRWEQMFALENGHVKQKTFEVQVERLKVVNGTLGVKLATARVAAQLRYEYALNLLHRLGNSLSRVGLDFVKHD